MHSGEKLFRADDELAPLALQNHGGFTGSERSAALNFVRFAFERYLPSRLERLQPKMIFLRVNFFHELIHSISANVLKPETRCIQRDEDQIDFAYERV